jgi:hypothetical protein
LATQWRSAKTRFEKKDEILLKEYNEDINGLLVFVSIGVQNKVYFVDLIAHRPVSSLLSSQRSSSSSTRRYRKIVLLARPCSFAGSPCSSRTRA